MPAVPVVDDPYKPIHRVSFRCIQFYSVLCAYYVHLPLLLIAVYPWIVPPSWMYNLTQGTQFTNTTQLNQSSTGSSIQTLAQVVCCFGSSEFNNNQGFFLFGTSSCAGENMTFTEPVRNDTSITNMNDEYWSYLPCQAMTNSLIRDNNCPMGSPYSITYRCGLNMVNSITPVVALARLVLGAVILKELIKLIGYGILHTRILRILSCQLSVCDAPSSRAGIQADLSSRQLIIDQLLSRMVWFSRSLLMLPYCLCYGWSEVYLLYEMEYVMWAGKTKVFVLDLFMQDLPHVVYTLLIFIVSANWAILNTKQSMLNVASLALSVAFTAVNLIECLRACCCSRNKNPDAMNRAVSPIIVTLSTEWEQAQGRK